MARQPGGPALLAAPFRGAWPARSGTDGRRDGQGRPGKAAGEDRQAAPWAVSRAVPQEISRASSRAVLRDPGGRRFLSLALPRLAVERRLRLRGLTETMPLALTVPGAHGPVIHAATRAAEAAGAVPGLRVVDVHGACPGLPVEDADPAGDAQALARLMLWARRWCPWTAVEEVGGPGLVMDVTGSTHLWGGEARLMAEIEGRLAALGLTARLAVAPTRGAAWALARHAGPRAVCPPGEIEAMAAPLPVRALRLSRDTALLLRRLGLRTIGDVLAVPRRPLARRFAGAEPGDDPLLRLDQLTGRRPEPLHCPDRPPRFVVRAALAEPVEDPTPLLPLLARDLCAMLASKGFGARRLSLAAYRSDGEVSAVEAAVSRPSRDPLHLARLLDGRLDGLDPGFGFDLLTLAATVAERLPLRQPGLDGTGAEGEGMAQLMDRLAARFGARALRRPVLRESHLPERREAWVPALGAAPSAASPQPPAPPLAPSSGPDRPLRLFDPPEEVRVTYALPEGPPAQFVWRRVTHRVVRVAGPERIAPEWWRERPGTRLRDYFKIEDHEGRRFWLFREGVSGDGRGGAPRWFVHGAFA